MKITEMTVTVCRTFNLGNFESLRIEAGASGSPEGDEEINLVRSRLLDETRESLAAAYVRFRKEKSDG